MKIKKKDELRANQTMKYFHLSQNMWLKISNLLS